ncbi:thiol-disulfide oxidoreductase DCC family protein [Pantoea alhagi]|uniref:thiol-disulfide oxidoreductase DCC family protein n=1 Tax=Pantoea alhagi TaxID=1891675 RepID=UPI00202B1232|nr:thiol-disulfide oxidoreductase DCC family protein [Pantoea alhagi]URQ59195.1 thiol-disulfide oxidoreductase DCC family protein [Pantoea alhagi]
MSDRAAPPLISSDEQVVLYDGTCRLCNGWVNFLLRYDKYRTVRLAAVQSEQGKALLRWAGLSTENISTIVLIRQGNVYLRAEAIFRVMAGLPWPWRILALLRLLPATLSNRCYDLIASNRYRLFGRYDNVQSLIADHPQRFLDR